jgi:hypothetical protein
MKETVKSGEIPRPRPKPTNAFKERDWKTLFVTGVFGLSFLATVAMCYISVTSGADNDNRFNIIPAAAVMFMVEIWLVLTLPVYGKLAFWGALITLATFLFFAVPFAYLGLLPTEWAIAAYVFSVISVVCGIFLYLERNRFIPPPPPRPVRPRPSGVEKKES